MKPLSCKSPVFSSPIFLNSIANTRFDAGKCGDASKGGWGSFFWGGNGLALLHRMIYYILHVFTPHRQNNIALCQTWPKSHLYIYREQFLLISHSLVLITTLYVLYNTYICCTYSTLPSSTSYNNARTVHDSCYI